MSEVNELAERYLADLDYVIEFRSRPHLGVVVGILMGCHTHRFAVLQNVGITHWSLMVDIDGLECVKRQHEEDGLVVKLIPEFRDNSSWVMVHDKNSSSLPTIHPPYHSKGGVYR